MQEGLQKSINDNRVSALKLAKFEYPSIDEDDSIQQVIYQNAENLNWADPQRGAFGKMIQEGMKVVIKPNFVLHQNQGRSGLLPLITHPSIIKTVVTEVLKANPSQVIVGDAPIQSCNFPELLRQTKLDEWSAGLQKSDPRFKGIIDFRRTISTLVNGLRRTQEEVRTKENYVLFNLKKDSLLEPLTDDKNSFRVTSYDPRLMAKTHSLGNHQYLVAREIIEANVVINLPKLKTHKKAGITSALKNLVGINGNKEYLPHHRIGGSYQGGDCYPGNDIIKRMLESVLDQQNMTTSPIKGKTLIAISGQLERIMRLKGDKTGVEGSWSGNQTVARMTLDLNRILLYGKIDATLEKTVQRRVLHIVDAVIAGQGDGPLASDELPLGFILAGENALALDWVGASMLGYDVQKIPLLKLALTNFCWPIASFDPSHIKILGGWNEHLTIESLLNLAKTRKIVHPAGWQETSI